MSWSRNPLDPSNLLSAAPALRSIVRRHGYDIVHVHTPVAAFVSRMALLRGPQSGVPYVVYTAHGFHFHHAGAARANGVYLSLERLAARWTRRLIVLNREDHDAAVRLLRFRPEHVCYMPGIGLDTRALCPDRVSQAQIAWTRQQLRLSDSQPLFLMIAGFDPGKRHADLLHAFSQVKRKDVVLALAGAGRLEPAMHALAFSLGIADRVRFLGYRTDIPTLIRSSLATILPSEREGLSRSVLESLSLGVPVIGSNARGVGELLDGGGGLRFDVGDVIALRDAMAWMLENPGRAAQMGASARVSMARYDIGEIIRRHEEIYGTLLGAAETREEQHAALV